MSVATPEVTREAVRSFDLSVGTVRELNQALHSGVGAGGRVVVDERVVRRRPRVGVGGPAFVGQGVVR